METTSLFCRLCASNTRSQHLRSFDSVRRESCALLAAVQRIHPSICRGDGLPQTVCKSCVRRVKALATFVKEVENAQTFLEKIFASNQAIKREKPPENEIEVVARCENKSNKHLKENSDVKVKEEVVKEEFVLPVQITQFVKEIDVKYENSLDTQETSLFYPTSEIFANISHDFDPSNQTILSQNSQKLFDRTLEKTIKCDKPPKKRTFTQTIALKIIETADPHWSDFWQCFRCDEVYRTVYDLRNHSIEAHDRCVVFKCATCPKKIYKFKHFLKHMILHYDLLKRRCEFCDLCFDSQSKATKHKQAEHALENKKHKCVKCGVTFDFVVDLKCHKDSYTNVILKKKDRIYICHHCGKNYSMKSLIASHMKDHYPNSYRCKMCSKTFKHKSYRDNHESSVHNTTSQFICQICGKICKSIGNLKAHVNVHVGYKPYSCDICNKKFRLPYQVRSHRLSHGGPMQHTCPICGKSFRYKSCLYQHKNIHAAVKPYSCTICPRDFTGWPNYNKHMKRIHGTNMAKLKAKKDAED